MSAGPREWVEYRLRRALETYDDALLLVENQKWNSAINRLYYAAYYAISALLLHANLDPATHNGIKSAFSSHFIRSGKCPPEMGRTFSQLYTWRHKGDYDDMFDFDGEKVMPYLAPTKHLIDWVKVNVV